MLEHQTLTVTKIGVSHSFDYYHLLQANQEEIQSIATKFDIPEDFITSGLDSYEVARFETYTNKHGEAFTLSLFNYPFKERTEDFRDIYRTAPIAIVTKPGLVIITSLDSLESLDNMTDVNLNSFEGVDELGLMLNILWFVSRLYIHLLEEIDQEIRDLEMAVTETTKNDIFYGLMKLNKALVFFHSGINNNQAVLNRLKEQFKEMDADEFDFRLLRDVNVELHQASGMVNELKQFNEKVSDILSNVVNNNMNQIMRVLTVWSIILTIPAIIGGFWGMNVPVPGEGAGSSMLIISVITIGLMGVSYWLFKRNKWM